MQHLHPSLTTHTDKILVTELSRGNETVFKKLYDMHSNSIYAYALSLLKCKVRAEEIVQDVFLTIWSGREKLDASLSFKSYLFTITRNKSFNLLKKAAYDIRLREEVFYQSQKSQVPKAGQVQEGDIEKMKQQLINLLPPKRKLIFQMSRNQGKSYADISQEMGISISTVKNQMSKALETIRTVLLKSGQL